MSETLIAEPRSRRFTIVAADLLIAAALATVAFLVRLNLPKDGLFYDDAWQVLAASKGTVLDFPLVGQTQPGFTLGLMVWSRLFGTSTASMIAPALIAGALGPPALYLVLRRFAFPRSIAVLLGATFTVAATHIIFSDRVKSYTADILIVLLVASVLPALVRQRWRPSTAIAWVAGAMLAASFSSFGLLVAVTGGIILVLHARGDRRLRVVTVATQFAACGALLLVEERTYNARALRGFFSGKEAFLQLEANPLRFGRDVLEHAMRVTEVFPGGGNLGEAVFLVVATVGLAVAAWRGPNRILARFLGLMVVIVCAGAVVHRIPFGPETSGGGGRLTLWMIPSIAVGIASALQYARRASTRPAYHAGFDVLAYLIAVILLFSTVGAGYEYPEEGARVATRRVMADLGPSDTVLITRSAFFSFALQAQTPVDLRADSDGLVGFLPDFEDPRLHLYGFETSEEELGSFVQGADRVYVVNAGGAGSARYREYLIRLALELTGRGFDQQATETIGRAHVDTWQRRD